MAAPGEDHKDGQSVEEYRNLLISACIAKNKAEVSNLLSATTEKVGEVLSLKNKYGTTPLHEACMCGAVDCILLLLKHGKEANVFDARGYAPIHCAAYNNHTTAIKVLLDYRPVDANLSTTSVDQPSAYDETPLHIACMQGSVNAVEYLYRNDAHLNSTDSDGNNILHFISISNCKDMWAWFLGLLEQDQSWKKLMFTGNKNKETAAHVAASMGNKVSIGVLVQQKMDFDLVNDQKKSAKDIMEEHGHIQCSKLASGEVSPPAILISSSPNPSSFENFKRSFSTESTSPRVSRRGSFTGMDRPRNLAFYKQPSSELKLPRRGSSFSVKSGGSTKSSDSLVNAITVSKDNLNRIKEEFRESMNRRGSITSESAIATVIEQTAYEPPFHGVHFTKKEILTPKNAVLNWDEHDVKFATKLFLPAHNRDLTDDGKASPLVRNSKHEKLEVCLSLSMTSDLHLPSEYTILSPICFVSCKHERCLSSKFSLILPHAVKNAVNVDKDAFKILSFTTCMVNEPRIESPLSEYPPNMHFTEIAVESLEVYPKCIKFRSVISNPSLFAVAMKNAPSSCIPRPTPILRCILFCVYYSYDQYTNISFIPIKLYVGMGFKTVQKIMQDTCSRQNYDMKELYFNIMNDSFTIHTAMSNRENWMLESGKNHVLRYSQVALTGDTDQQSYSHELSYPPHRVVNIVPRRMEGPASCEVTVQDSHGEELGSLHCLPYSPYKSASQTPKGSPPPSSAQYLETKRDSKAMNKSTCSLSSSRSDHAEREQIHHSSQDSDNQDGSTSTVTPNSPPIQFRASSSNGLLPPVSEPISYDNEAHRVNKIPQESNLESQLFESTRSQQQCEPVPAQQSTHQIDIMSQNKPVTETAVKQRASQSLTKENVLNTATLKQTLV